VCKVLAMAMQKGGVGKSTTSVSLAAGLAELGARVLLIDLDPQANATQGVGCDPDALDYSIYEVLLNPERGCDFATLPEVVTVAGDRLGCVDLIPSTLALAGAEVELASKIGRELLLRKALVSVRDRYDYILIDPPPSLGLFTLNALAVADSVIVPFQLHAYAFKALPQLETTIALVRELNPGLEIGGVVCTLGTRTNLAASVERRVRDRYNGRVFDTVIPTNISLAEAPAAGKPIMSYAPTSLGATAYRALSREVWARYAC